MGWVVGGLQTQQHRRSQVAQLPARKPACCPASYLGPTAPPAPAKAIKPLTRRRGSRGAGTHTSRLSSADNRSTNRCRATCRSCKARGKHAVAQVRRIAGALAAAVPCKPTTSTGVWRVIQPALKRVQRMLTCARNMLALPALPPVLTSTACGTSGTHQHCLRYFQDTRSHEPVVHARQAFLSVHLRHSKRAVLACWLHRAGCSL